MAIVSKKSFSIDDQKARQSKGPLIRVELRPGQFVKMYEADAIAAGHIKPKTELAQKSMPAQENKMRLPETEKQETAVPPSPDDFGEIEGVGPATARRLIAQGITTFDELRNADLSFLNDKQRGAIEEWRNG
jgi:predicted flap endonuclease-1-like 5' DNA nuclease